MVSRYSAYRGGSDTVPPDIIDRILVGACAAIWLVLLGTSPSAFLSVALLCLLAAGVFSCLGPFWTLPSEFLSGYSAAAGIALINSVGNLGGFVGPAAIGFISQRTGTLSAGLALSGIPMFLSAALVLLLPKQARTLTKG